ncbi:MAG: response regulator [Desulfobacteraceae bacterium]|jgi:PAS domain S-box-containing protein|nr:response regulator [Desulfobacteraceae bacterium]
MKKNILVVDDDRVMLKFISKLLTREGHEVATAEDGFAALTLLSTFTPDIMFFDLIMPKIDGGKLIQIVRSMPQLKDCYLVIISAAVAEIDFDFEQTGADSYIAKGPFSSMSEHIKEVIETCDTPQKKHEEKPIRGLDNVYARQLTKELLSRSRHLETILESMAEGILEIFSNKIVYANGVAVSLLGLPPEKILAAYPPDLFKDSVGRQLDNILKSNREEPAEIGEKTPVALNGRQITLKILPVKGETSTVIIMITDVTERKRLEMQLQHVQKMEAIGTIAAGVAHNFRNTLTEILVNSQLIQMNYDDQSGLHEVAGRINTSVRRGSRLVDGLLQFSRKQIKEEFKIINLSEVINQTVQIIRKSFDQKFQILTEYPDQLPIMGDTTSVSQALMNLCTNARDAMPAGGQLAIKAVQEDRRIVVTVSDNGEGMGKETVEKCFDPFYTTKPIGKGTGLGLSTTYGIVKSHEGLISVESQAGKGTAFKILFPLAQGEEELNPIAERPLARGDGQLVLVVDDEPDIQTAMKELLEYLGYKPEFASSGTEGLDRYKAVNPAAVLMDINMPEMDGIACIEEILNYDPDAKISIISGYELDGMNGLGKKAQKSIKDYLPKPVGLGDLSALLAKMFQE